jgi:hypothetical protein
MAKKTDPTKKKWNSLSQLKSHFEKDGGEKVVSFDGIELVTGRYRYTLAFGELYREKK